MRSIPDPGFAGDTGAPEPALTAALAAYDADPQAGYLPALAALCASRLLVPVVAQGEESAGADMAAVLMRHPDGRTALLAFTGTPALTGWDADARPVPVPVATAALSALQEQAAALLVDLAGPVRFVVQGEDLVHLARGWRLVALEDGGWGWDTGATATDVRS